MNGPKIKAFASKIKEIVNAPGPMTIYRVGRVFMASRERARLEAKASKVELEVITLDGQPTKRLIVQLLNKYGNE